MTIATRNHLWPAEDYHLHSSVQKSAAVHLLHQFQLKGDEQVLDVGCGDGKITAEIAKRVPEGFVVGLDVSSEMINFARKSFSNIFFPNLNFLVQDAHQFNYSQGLDVVFSSFALQWLQNPGLFFKSAYSSLKFTGCIAATIPLGISAELESAIKSTISFAEWAPYFHAFSPCWHFITDVEYKRLLMENGFIPMHFSVACQSVFFNSRSDFENYIIPWFSYLHPLPPHLKRVFFKQVIDKCLELNPCNSNEKIIFNFQKLDFVAKKANL